MAFHRRGTLPLVLTIAALALLVAVGAVYLGRVPIDLGRLADLPADQRRAVRTANLKRTQEAQAAFRRAFAGSGVDMHSLPVVELNPQVEVAPDLAGALQSAGLVVRGTVIGQSVDPFVVSEISIDSVLRGRLAGSLVKVRQPGGPFLNGNEPAVMQRASDPLLRQGRTYVLFLAACKNPEESPESGVMCSAASPAQLEVTPGGIGRVHPNLHHTWVADYSNRPVFEVEAAIRSTQPRSGGAGPGAPWVPAEPETFSPDQKRPSP